MTEPKKYQDPAHKDKKLMVIKGWWGDHYITIRTRNDGDSGHRVVSPSLPERATFFEAQADLDAYAEKHGFKEV